MRILFVHTIGKNKFGGGERWLVNAAAGLRDRGHSVIVGGKPGSRLLEASGGRGLATAGFNILSDLSVYHIFKIARFIRKRQIDVVVSRDRDLSVTGPAALIAGRVPVLVRYGSPLRSSFSKHAFLLRRFASGVITNTLSIKEFMEMGEIVPRGFVRVVYNGLPAPADDSVYDFRGRFPGKMVIVTAGRLTVEKGYLYLVDAAAMLRRKFDNLVFIVLGEGKHRGRIERYARGEGVEDIFHLEGYVKNIMPYLRGCDIFVLPSLYEGMPNAAMEAMACGKPVVLTDVNGAGELVPDGDKGVLVPAHNPQAVADAIERLAENSRLRDSIGKVAAEFVRSNFRYDRMIDELECCLNECLDKRPGDGGNDRLNGVAG